MLLLLLLLLLLLIFLIFLIILCFLALAVHLLLQVVPQYLNMPEFLTDWQVQSPGAGQETPLSWQLVQTVFSLLQNTSEQEAGGEPGSRVRAGLGLSLQPPSLRVDRLDVGLARWGTVAEYREGEEGQGGLVWSSTGPASTVVEQGEGEGEGCLWCHCVNGSWRGDSAWVWDTWVTSLLAVSCIGIIATLAVLVFLLTQCSQVTSFSFSFSFSYYYSYKLSFYSFFFAFSFSISFFAGSRG